MEEACPPGLGRSLRARIAGGQGRVGDPVPKSGAKAHLRIRFQADMHYADGSTSLERSLTDEPPGLVFGGDFENQVTWFHGVQKQRPFRVTYVGDGRVAVDVVR